MGVFDLVKDVGTLVTAPIEVVATTARIVTKPLAEMADELVEDLEELVEDD